MPTLQECRLSQNLTQGELAQRAGVSTATVNRAERGHFIQRGTLILLCNALRERAENITDINVFKPVRAAKREMQREA